MFSKKEMAAIVEEQVRLIKGGRSFADLVEPATIANGHIVQIPAAERQKYIDIWEKSQDKFTKFVPASGAASRMFKDLKLALSKGFTSIDELKREKLNDAVIFFEKLTTFPFYGELREMMANAPSPSPLSSAEGGQAQGERVTVDINKILRYLLTSVGLNYAESPKLFLTFNLDSGHPRTAFDEHIKEAVWLTGGHVHFIVSPEHLRKGKALASEAKKLYKKHGIKLDISFSIQEPSTDVVALRPGTSELVRDDDGEIFFRQGGHGSLATNLEKMDAPFVLIQNVDNLPGGSERILSVKRAFMGFAVAKYNELKAGGDLTRPLVVAAMVTNVGEPGGGPFVVRERSTGVVDDQIIEGAQMDRAMAGTHFNPVFLIVCMRDARGKKWWLSDFAKRDGEALFFVEKSDAHGEPFVSIERGLWNGEMWNMKKIFVDMPIETFGPAKTVNDLSPEIRKYRKEAYPEII